MSNPKKFKYVSYRPANSKIGYRSEYIGNPFPCEYIAKLIDEKYYNNSEFEVIFHNGDMDVGDFTTDVPKRKFVEMLNQNN